MQRILFVLLCFGMVLACINSPVYASTFNKMNADVKLQFVDDSRWVYVADTDTAEYYVDEANSKVLINNGPFSQYIAYVLRVYKHPTSSWASAEHILYFYDREAKKLYSSTLDFRSYRVGGIIFTPQALNIKVPTPLKEIVGDDKLVGDKVFPYFMK